MPSTTHQFGYNRRFYASLAKETTFGTAVAMSRFLNLLPGAGITHKWDTAKRAEEATGVEMEDRQIPLRRDASGTISVNASIEAMALLSAFALGDSTVAAAFTSAYLHTIVPAAVGTHWSFSAEQHEAGAADATAGSSQKFAGCVFNSFRWIFERNGLVRLEGDLIGSGTVADGAAKTESGMVGPDVYIPSSWCEYYLGACTLDGDTAYDGTIGSPGTSLTPFGDLGGGALTGQVERAQIEWGNNTLAEEGYGVGSTTTATYSKNSAYHGRRTGTLSLTLDDPQAALIASLQGGTRVQKSFQVTGVSASAIGSGGFKAFSIVIPRMEIDMSVQKTYDLAVNKRTLQFTIGKEDVDGYESIYVFVWTSQSGPYLNT